MGTDSTRPGRWRGPVAVLAVVLASVSFLAAGVGTWMQRSTLERDVWERRVGSLGEDEAIQRALSVWATEQLLATIDVEHLVDQHVVDRTGRFTGAVAGVAATRAAERLDEFVTTQVDAFFASPRFAAIWATAANTAHEQAVKVLRDERGSLTADDEKIRIDLVPLLREVLVQIDREVPALLGDDGDAAVAAISGDLPPQEARARIAAARHVELPPEWGTITVYDGGKLAAAQEAVRWIDRLPVLTAALTVAFAAVALLVAPRRRRVALGLVAGFAVACIAVQATGAVLQARVLEIIADDVGRDAARALMSTLIDPLTGAALVTLAVLAVVAVVLVLTGRRGRTTSRLAA